ncbi:CPBP family intramembrane glutamic endopeptidase [Aquimarina intermedia]|uniref:Membrane protease YdiL (CAAX protease family) n=1 Tax=Aquimarina intermedia TaxID=350814 RepID=A0A5S5CAE6_9FLAO|nr:CPBP family intramembrane glutamic endopeptidase [Aquimarina intermedia]TYP76119.1 membrane protease YdiL (CAAX protease family) [Aquimarina intermedia]
MTCHSCTQPINASSNYCAHCGTSISLRKRQTRSEGLNLIIVFYIVELVFLTIVHLIYNDHTSLTTEIAIESVSAALVLIFVFFDIKNIVPLYSLPKLRPLEWIGVLWAPFITGFSVYYGIEWMNAVLFDESTNYYATYVEYNNPFLLAFVFIAILPAIFEEVAFRGFLFNQLERITSVRITILLTAFLFALVHFSFISILWIFPFGLLLGYLRHRYQSLWLGMIIHFVHNLIIVSLDYYYFDPLFY